MIKVMSNDKYSHIELQFNTQEQYYTEFTDLIKSLLTKEQIKGSDIFIPMITAFTVSGRMEEIYELIREFPERVPEERIEEFLREFSEDE